MRAPDEPSTEEEELQPDSQQKQQETKINTVCGGSRGRKNGKSDGVEKVENIFFPPGLLYSGPWNMESSTFNILREVSIVVNRQWDKSAEPESD